MHDGLYQNQEVLGVPLFVALSEALDVTKQKLIHALKQQNFKAKIETDVMGGVRSGVSGTPALFIDGNRYRGAYDFNALAAAVRGYREADAHL
jgi:protein-disulfide isomerase